MKKKKKEEMLSMIGISDIHDFNEIEIPFLVDDILEIPRNKVKTYLFFDNIDGWSPMIQFMCPETERTFDLHTKLWIKDDYLKHIVVNLQVPVTLMADAPELLVPFVLSKKIEVCALMCGANDGSSDMVIDLEFDIEQKGQRGNVYSEDIGTFTSRPFSSGGEPLKVDFQFLKSIFGHRNR